ncbi:hypothetical protein [Micromonospora coerulea]|uniref:hypothetical protein n=1 Tax=Micromonospora coerulea TaxID=47856 RepID=UPI00190488CA|nr:hypothetical protein [Micromonospora veneta]
MADNFLLPGEDWIGWAVRTGRFRPERAEHWRGKLDRERQHIEASGGDTAQSRVVEEIRQLHPVYASAQQAPPGTVPTRAAAAAAATSGTPRTDALLRAVYGPTREQVYAEQDAALEARLAEQAEQEPIAASAGLLTDDEYRSLFGDE